MDAKIVKELLAKPGVVSVGRGHKRAHGTDTGRPCIVVGVRKKLPLSQLKAEHIIPKTVGSRAEETDVVELGDIKLL